MMHPRVRSAVAVVSFGLFFAASTARGQEVVISEFMAINDGVVLDSDGAPTDWIEVLATSSSTVALDGWYLTDDPTELTKWRFPSIDLEPGEHLVVFASGNDRRDPFEELHTNFKLTGEGEYLALVEPDGLTVASEFAPLYPLQFADLSYGIERGREVTTLVGVDAPARAIVPTGPIGAVWTTAGFGDGAWTSGVSGVGFDLGTDYDDLIGLDLEGAMHDGNASAYVRFPFAVTSPSRFDDLRLRIRYDDGFVAYLNGTEVARRNAPSTPQWNSAATATHGQPETGSTSAIFSGGGDSPYVLTVHGSNTAPRVLAGGPTGSYLELLADGVGSLTNTIGFARSFGEARAIDASFDFRMPTEASHTGCCGERADGFGFALCDTAVYGNSGPGPASGNVVWERPVFPSVFSIGFDIFDGSGNENTMTLNWNGVTVASRLVSAFQLNNGVFNRCEVEIREDGAGSLVTVRLIEDSLGTPEPAVLVFDEVRVGGMTAFENRVAFGGRTGGAFISLDLDNIDVRYSSAVSTEIESEEISLAGALDELVDGDNVLAIHGLNRTAGDGDFLIVPELEGIETGSIDPNDRRYFEEPTPGEPNHGGVPGFAELPIFSHPGGAFTTSVAVDMSVLSPDAVIRYTTNRSEPTEGSAEFTSPLTFTNSTILKVKVFEDGLLPSPTITKTYLRVSSTLGGFDSDLPLVVIETFGQGIGSGAQTAVFAAIIDTDEVTGRAEMLAEPHFQGAAGMKQRGSSSSGFPKKQWTFEVWDDASNDRAVSLLGMPRESDWILYAPYSDKSLMRNVLSYEWFGKMGHYTVRTRFVEAYLNTGGGSIATGDYIGVYVLMEKIKRDDERVAIQRLLPTQNSNPEITGGYIFKKDRLDPGDSGFTTSSGQRLAYVDPKEQEITSAQADWLRSHLNTFESALGGGNFADPNLGYARYIDPDSFIDTHILVELTKNIDGYRLSSFYYKDRDDRIKMGPAWDYNLSLGNADYNNGWITSGWYYSLLGADAYPWYPRLFQDANFRQRYTDRWAELRRGPFRTDRLLDDVDDHNADIAESQVRNFDRWAILGVDVWPNWYVADTHAEEIDWMKGWIDGRVRWIDSNFLGAPTFNQDGGLIAPGFELRMNATVGTIYYTLDGSDPRLSGGDVSPAAIEYGSAAGTTLVSSAASSEVRVLVPANGTLGTTWTEFAFDDSGWDVGTTGVGVGYETGSGYESYIDVDVEAVMDDVNPTVYVRIPFEVADADAVENLTLRMRYDDGFVAYINGTRVASANSPALLAWNSSATGLHDDSAAVQFESLNASDGVAALRDGGNVLAIHGLNESIGSSDFLIEPVLVASTAFEGDAVILGEATHVIARAESGGEWSAPTDEVFVLESDLPLRISEVHYHPQDLPGGSPYAGGQLEFIEIVNIGNVPVDLAGVEFAGGIFFDFTTGDVDRLGAGEFLVVVRDLEAFSWFYDTSTILVAGSYTGSLDNGGESILLIDGIGEPILQFAYRDDWYPETDGAGSSLVIRDLGAAPDSWNDAASWMIGGVVDGTPGSGEGDPPPPSGFQRTGDANQDARLDVSDGLALLRRLFGNVGVFPCETDDFAGEGNRAVLDVNGDDGVDVSDVVYLLNYLFTNGPPPNGGVSCRPVVGCPDVCE